MKLSCHHLSPRVNDIWMPSHWRTDRSFMLCGEEIVLFLDIHPFFFFRPKPVKHVRVWAETDQAVLLRGESFHVSLPLWPDKGPYSAGREGQGSFSWLLATGTPYQTAFISDVFLEECTRSYGFSGSDNVSLFSPLSPGNVHTCVHGLTRQTRAAHRGNREPSETKRFHWKTFVKSLWSETPSSWLLCFLDPFFCIVIFISV